VKLNKSKYCLNCNEEINNSNYCSNCGQLNSDKRLTLRQIFKEFIGDYFTFDSKFFKSLVPLLIKPGYLTREYLRGRRVTYIFPLRLYIFTTFLFFFVVTVNTKLDFDKFANGDRPIDSTKVDETNIEKSSLAKNSFEEKIKAKTEQEVNYSVNSTDSTKEINIRGPGFEFSFDDDEKDESPFVRYMNNKGKYLAGFEDGSSLFWKEVINQLPKVMFLLLPLFALILKLLYSRKKILYVEHLVFSLHIHTFIFIMLIIASLIANVYIIFGIIFLIFVYIFLSQYKFYEQSIIKSLFKYFILMSIYLFTLIPAFGVLAFLAFISI
jgi:hypothetical protein